MALVMPDGNPSPMSQSTYQSPYDQISNAYSQYLGRNPESAQAVMSHLGNGKATSQSAVDFGINQIRNSPEAQEYARRQQEGQNNAPPAQQQMQNSAPVQNGGGGQPAPGVPPVYAGPNLSTMISDAQKNAPQIQSQFVAQQIRDFTGRALDIPNYNQTQFQQFSDPRDQRIMDGRNDLLLHLIQNPESMSQLWQDQMFESGKDDALALSKQLGLQNSQALVGRGLNLGGGSDQAFKQALDSDLAGKLLAGRRDVATKAATQNFADRLNALGAVEAGLTGDTSRAGSIFQNILAGQQAQAQDNQFAAKYGFDSTNALAQNERDNYSSYLSGRGLQGQENARAEQFRQSAFGLSQQARQNAAQQALNEFMAANNADLGWANYGLSADQQFLNFLQGGY